MRRAPRRIVFVQSGLGAGGAEKVINLLARHRASAGDEITVVAFSGFPSESYFQYPENVRVLTYQAEGAPDRGGIARVHDRVRWLRNRFQELTPDLVVSFLTKINVITLLAAMGTGLPVVVSERNNPVQQNASRIWHLAGRAVLRRAQRIVMQTTSAQMTLPPGLRHISCVIPNPASIPQTFRSNFERPHGVVAAGRLSHQKGFDLLLQAFAEATCKDSASLVIWGEGPERARLQVMIEELGLGDRVSLKGRSAEPCAWLGSGDIFVLSSRFEGFPNALIEAMAGGLAPIAFDCAWGPSDMIQNGETGLLVPDGDVEALTAALSQVLGDATLRRRLQTAARDAAKRFSEESVFAAWDTTFETAMCGRG